MTTAAMIRQAREAAGLTQRQLAEASGVPLRTLEKLEQGVIPEPKLVTIARLARPLGKTCADFIPADLQPPKPSKRK
ncbi:MAG: helix-turn-helix transcriptional regulator [Gemmataceae bacterium]